MAEASPVPDAATPSRRARVTRPLRTLVRVIREGDERKVEETVLAISRSRRFLAPVAFAVSAVLMVFDGLRLLVSNWRLTIVQLLPAVWIWLALYDLKVHVLRGKSFNVIRGPVLIPIVLLIAAITVAGFFLNATFAYAITGPQPPEIKPAFARAREHFALVLVTGGVVGILLGIAAVVVNRFGVRWYALSMGAVVGLLMLCYVTVPARIVGIRPAMSRRDRIASMAVGGALSALVCTPPYIISRVGIVMLGSHVLFVPGVVLLTVGATLQAGATSSVKAIKMSVKLVGHPTQA